MPWQPAAWLCSCHAPAGDVARFLHSLDGGIGHMQAFAAARELGARVR